MKTLKLAVAFLGILITVQVKAASTEVIAVPAAVGNSFNGFPFSVGGGLQDSFRYQQVYGASAFAPPLSQGGLITALGFNVKSGSFLATTLPDIQIDFSTTSKLVDGLSTTFAANVGADDKIVFARGPMGIFPNGPGTPPGFNVVINLTTPFFYNPSAGNLLMDVRYYHEQTAGFAPGFFDASDHSGDSVSRVYAFDVGDATGIADTVGLITVFVVTPVPEPTAGVLLLTGLGAFGLFAGPGLRRSLFGKRLNIGALSSGKIMTEASVAGRAFA